MDSHGQASMMERGEAGMPPSPPLSPACEKSPTGLSPSTTSSSKPLFTPTIKSRILSSLELISRKLNFLDNSSWARKLQLLFRPKQNIPHLIVRKLSSCPRGYPSLAAFLDSDENFMIYRRFGFLQSRLLLDKQDELRELEETLDRMDKRQFRKDAKLPMTRDLSEEDLRPRAELLALIEKKFCSYANLLVAGKKMMSMHRPAKENYTSVSNFMYNHTPFMESEASWIEHAEDLITLRAGREHAWLDAVIETLLKVFHCSLIAKIFGDERSRQKSSKDEIYYSREKITRLANCILTMTILTLLIVPIYTLYHLINDIHTDKAYAIGLGVLVVATLAFSAVLSLFTRAKRQEILAAAAAYCAVLVVFLGNVGPKSR